MLINAPQASDKGLVNDDRKGRGGFGEHAIRQNVDSNHSIGWINSVRVLSFTKRFKSHTVAPDTKTLSAKFSNQTSRLYALADFLQT